MSHTISKEFDFCFGHRVWSQDLNQEYALTSKCKCRFMHGHSGRVMIHLTAPELKNGLITDFNHLNWLKEFIDTNLDHKFIIDRNDPVFCHLMAAAVDMEEGLDDEYTEGFYIVDFIPTSENLAKFIFDIVQTKMQPLGVKVVKVEWWETPKSKSEYTGE